MAVQKLVSKKATKYTFYFIAGENKDFKFYTTFSEEIQNVVSDKPI